MFNRISFNFKNLVIIFLLLLFEIKNIIVLQTFINEYNIIDNIKYYYLKKIPK